MQREGSSQVVAVDDEGIQARRQIIGERSHEVHVRQVERSQVRQGSKGKCPIDGDHIAHRVDECAGRELKRFQRRKKDSKPLKRVRVGRITLKDHSGGQDIGNGRVIVKTVRHEPDCRKSRGGNDEVRLAGIGRFQRITYAEGSAIIVITTEKDHVDWSGVFSFKIATIHRAQFAQVSVAYLAAVFVMAPRRAE